MSKDYWLENAAAKQTGKSLPHTLVDLGNDVCCGDRATAMRQFVGIANFMVVGHGRLLCRIPPSKVAEVLAAMPAIKPASDAPGYCWCSHTWLT